MKIHPFTGGVPFDASMKRLKEQFTIEKSDVAVFEPDLVTIPFSQHIGAPNEALVTVGELVKKGQAIAKSDAFVSGQVHASISGRVTDIREVPAAWGGSQQAIVIERQLKSPTAEVLLPDELDVFSKIRAAGIVGLGGATFPSHVKLSPQEHHTIEYVVLNGTECEPFLSSDDYLMQQESAKILQGGEIIRKHLGAESLLVSIETDTPQALRKMRQTAQKLGLEHCEIIPVPITYPQGGEGQLIETLLGREIPFGGLPADIGVVLFNVATAFAIGEAVQERKVLTRRYLTVCGRVQTPQVLSFPLGTRVRDIIDFCGGPSEPLAKVLLGGPMMGKALTDLDTPLTKGSNGLVLLGNDDISHSVEQPCIRCNRCVAVCPVRLEPQNIDLAYRAGDLYTCDQLVATRCINCGCCTYVCPARRNLAANITKANQEIKQIKKELAQND